MSKIKKPTKSSSLSKNGNEVITKTRILLVIIALFLYGSSIGYKFTLDDDIFYLKHSSVQKGISGFSEFFSYGSMNKFDGTIGVQPYRPITLLSFGLEKQIFNNSPAMSHFLNLLLYIFILQIVFSLIKQLFPTINPILLGLIAILYAVHPIHTEVVCSVKSRDELLAALFGFLAWLHYILGLHENGIQKNKMILGLLFFTLALLSKESAIAFLVIIPLSIIMFKNASLKNTLFNVSPLIVVTSIFLLVRSLVIGNTNVINGIPILENVLNSASNFGEATATRMEILFYYIKLIFIPWPLNWDYSFNQIPIVGWDNILPIASLIIYGGLGIISIINFKKNPILSFSILFFFVSSAPTNNIFFINGATLGERFLFVPSFAYALGITYLLISILKIDSKTFQGKNKSTFNIVTGSIILIFISLTIVRSADWKNNFALFQRGVEVSPNSSRTHYSLASEYLAIAQSTNNPQEKIDNLNKANDHFKKSLAILPSNFQAHYNSGLCYSLLGDTLNAIESYKSTINLNSTYLVAMNNLGVIYQAKQNFDSAFVYYDMAFKIDPKAPASIPNLANLFFSQGIFYSQGGNTDAALVAYKRSLTYDENNVMTLNNIGSIYSNKQNYDSALVFLKRGYNNDTSNLMIIENIGAVSYFNKNYSQAIEFASKALVINNRLRKSIGVLADSYRAIGNIPESVKYQQMLQAQ